MPEGRIAARAMYRHHASSFDRCVKFFLSNGLNPRKYLKFMAIDVRLRDSEIDSKFMSRWSLNRFAEKLATGENLKKIYAWYIRSIKTMAKACLDSECASTVDFMRKLIREKKLASWIVCGKISIYYLAAIPGFPKIVEKLDPISRDELSFVSSRFDIYNTAVNQATLAYEKRRANPVRATDEMIEKIRPEWQKQQEKNMLFDPSLN